MLTPAAAAEWMKKIQQGDDQAFEFLVRHYQRTVVAAAYRFLQNAAEAEDAAQETFVKIFRAAGRFRPDANFNAWLFTILRRVCLNHLRHRRRHPDMPMEYTAGGETIEILDVYPDRGASNALHDLVRKEEAEQVRRAVFQLNPDERMALILEHWEGMPLAEIAEVLQRTISAVKSMLFRARKKLQKKISLDRELAKAR